MYRKEGSINTLKDKCGQAPLVPIRDGRAHTGKVCIERWNGSCHRGNRNQMSVNDEMMFELSNRGGVRGR